MEFEGQNNDFGGTKRYNNIPLVPPNSCGPPTMVAVVVDFKDRGSCTPLVSFPKIHPNLGAQASLTLNVVS